MAKNKGLATLKEIIKMISTIVSWTLFVLLLMSAIFLFYYFLTTTIYSLKGEKYEPRFSLYTIISPSMTPNINVYDVILDLRVDDPEDIEIGDVITFISSSPETSGMTITHRVISIIKDNEGNYSFKTKGDYSPIEDTSAVDFNSIIGRVAFKIPQLGRIQLFVASKFGWLFVVLIPALYIVVKSLMNSLKKIKDSESNILMLPYSFIKPHNDKPEEENKNMENKEIINDTASPSNEDNNSIPKEEVAEEPKEEEINLEAKWNFDNLNTNTTSNQSPVDTTNENVDLPEKKDESK